MIEVADPSPELRAFVRTHDIPHEDLGHRLILHSGGEEIYHRITSDFCDQGCTLRLSSLEDVFLKLTGRELRE